MLKISLETPHRYNLKYAHIYTLLRRVCKGPAWGGITLSSLQHLVVQEWLPTSDLDGDQIKIPTLLSVDARIYTPRRDLPSSHPKSEPSLSLRIHIIGRKTSKMGKCYKSKEIIAQWMNYANMWTCHCESSRISVEFMYRFLNTPRFQGEMPRTRECEHCNTVFGMIFDKITESDKMVEEEYITATRWINLGRGLEPPFYETYQSLGFPRHEDDIDAHEKFRRAHKDAGSAMHLPRLWERNLDLLKEDKFKEVMEYIGDGDDGGERKLKNWQKRPTWVMLADRV